MAGLKGKHIFGLVTVGEKGQIVIPSEARKIGKGRPVAACRRLAQRARAQAMPTATTMVHMTTSKLSPTIGRGMVRPRFERLVENGSI